MEQGRRGAVVRRVDGSTMLYEEPHQIEGALTARIVQWRPPVSVGPVHVRTALEQQRDERGVGTLHAGVREAAGWCRR